MLNLQNEGKRANRFNIKNHKLRAGWDLAISKRHNKTLIIVFVHHLTYFKFLKCCLADGKPCKSSLSRYFFVPIK